VGKWFALPFEEVAVFGQLGSSFAQHERAQRFDTLLDDCDFVLVSNDSRPDSAHD
jgi:hypothetical protein